MSISDELMIKYFELLTDEDVGAVKKMHPREAKMLLAKIIIRQYHSAQEAAAAQEEFERVFSQKQAPQDMPVIHLSGAKKSILEIIVQNGLAASKNEARRLIAGGGVYLDSERIDIEEFLVEREGILKVGKRRFLRIRK